MEYIVLTVTLWGGLRIKSDGDLSSQIPGGLPEFDLDDEDFKGLLPNFGDLTLRFKSLAILCLIGLQLAGLAALSAVFVPLCAGFVAFWAFGPVAVITWPVLIAWAIVYLGSSIIAFAQPLWITCCRRLVKMSLEKVDSSHDKLIRIKLSLLEAARVGESIVPFEVGYQSRLYVLNDVIVSQDLALDIALLSAHLYVPKPNNAIWAWISSILLGCLMFSRQLYSVIFKATKRVFWIFQIFISLVFLISLSSTHTLLAIYDTMEFVLACLFLPLRLLFEDGLEPSAVYVKRFVLLVTLKLMNIAYRYEILTSKYAGSAIGFTQTKNTWQKIWNNVIMDVSRVIDEISIPHFIRMLPDKWDADAINETQSILEQLGWPKSDPIVLGPPPDDDSDPSGAFDQFVIGYVPSVKQGIRNLDLKVAEELANLANLAPVYKRSEEYANVRNELASLSRYFSEHPVDLPDVSASEVFELVGDIFANSKLTPFAHILKKWEKKYGLGPFWADPDSKRWKKLSRKKFIKQIGGMAEMVKLWAKTFEVGSSLVPVSNVSVKGEALPEKKWKADSVRTVIGSPITHYIMSTIWNFFPNHNFRYWTTNIKIGMPLNGANIGRLVAEHSGYQQHFAGDFRDFDSTIQRKVSDIIKKVRKKGFEHHRDYAKICFLIDANYEGLLNMPLMTTSTGKVYKKVTGLSTGHSSTSLDNSLAVTIYYLIAWKELTGLSAHEFRYYNKLSNYGDDHLLSYRDTAPPSWKPENFMKYLTRCGVTLKDEEPSRRLISMEFLSKKWRHPTSQDLDDCRKAGVTCPPFVVYHNPLKLIGKAYAPSKDVKEDKRYRVKRLISYLDLCAHQPDLYDKIIYDIGLLMKGVKDPKFKPVVPSYLEVVKNWHNPAKDFSERDMFGEDVNKEDKSGMLLDYSMGNGFDTLVSIAAVIPDLINPAIYNLGYTNYLISMFGKYLTWPVELIRRSNSATTQVLLSNLLKRSCYDFLADHPALLATTNDDDDGQLLVRHWLYCLIIGNSGMNRFSNLFTWFDKKVATGNFFLNGYVQPVIKRFDLPIIPILAVALLSFMPGIKVPWFVKLIRLPGLTDLVERYVSFGINYAWSKVPANMKQTHHALSNLSPDLNILLVEAPTGTGKSTTFTNFVFRYHAHKYKRVIAIVPRQILVLTLAPYLRKAFGLPAEEVTEGHVASLHAKLIITTPNEALLHTEWLTEGNLFLVDEAHVNEPLLVAVIHVLKQVRACFVMLTATPSSENLETALVHIPLTIANTWTVQEVRSQHIDMEPNATYYNYWLDYRDRVLSLVKAHHLMKFLVFVVDKAQGDILASKIGRRVCVLSSANKVVDLSAEVFIATSVADVGLTIPDISWVITSDITRQLVPGQPSKLALVKMNSAVIKQRRGRTGRTSNGLFTLFTYKGPNWIESDRAWDLALAGVESLKAGVPASTIAKFFPDSIPNLWLNSERVTVDMYEQFVSDFDLMRKELDSNHQKHLVYDLDDSNHGELWTIQGNTVPIASYDDDGNLKKASSAFIFDFVTGAAFELAKKKIKFNKDSWSTYLRRSLYSSRTFRAWLSNGELSVPDSIKNNPYEPGDPSGRFGRRAPMAVKNYDPSMQEPDPLEGFSTFGNPQPMSPEPPLLAFTTSPDIKGKQKELPQEVDHPPHVISADVGTLAEQRHDEEMAKLHSTVDDDLSKEFFGGRDKSAIYGRLLASNEGKSMKDILADFWAPVVPPSAPEQEAGPSLVFPSSGSEKDSEGSVYSYDQDN